MNGECRRTCEAPSPLQFQLLQKESWQGWGWGAKRPNPTPATLSRRGSPFFDTL